MKGYGEFDNANRPDGWNLWLTFVLFAGAAIIHVIIAAADLDLDEAIHCLRESAMARTAIAAVVLMSTVIAFSPLDHRQPPSCAELTKLVRLRNALI